METPTPAVSAVATGKLAKVALEAARAAQVATHAGACIALERGRRDVSRLLRQAEGLVRLAVALAQAPPEVEKEMEAAIAASLADGGGVNEKKDVEAAIAASLVDGRRSHQVDVVDLLTPPPRHQADMVDLLEPPRHQVDVVDLVDDDDDDDPPPAPSNTTANERELRAAAAERRMRM